jgi:outer membrane protein assembly factor BamB
VTLDDDGPSSAACERSVCVFNTESCTVFAVNAETGKQLWSWWLGDPLTSSPTIADGRVFTSYPAHGSGDPKKPKPPTASHALAAFDLMSGKILWQKWLDSDVMSAPVAMNGFLYVSTFSGTLIKFEQSTGKIRYAIRTRATSAPVVTFGASGLESTYYTRRGEDEDDGAEEMIIRADHNKPKTKFKAHKRKAKYLDKKVQSSTEYAAEGISNDSANGFSGGAPAAANPMAANENIGQASVHTMQAFQGSRILHFDDRLVNTMGDEVVATSAETGEKIWSYKLDGDVAKDGGFLGTAPLAAGDSVIVATLKGKVLRLDPKSGKTRSTYSIGARVRSQPVVANGWIYVGTEDGRLVAINTGDSKMTGWPMWGGNAARTGVRLAAAAQR